MLLLLLLLLLLLPFDESEFRLERTMRQASCDVTRRILFTKNKFVCKQVNSRSLNHGMCNLNGLVGYTVAILHAVWI